MEVIDNDKHSSLLHNGIHYNSKKFIVDDAGWKDLAQNSTANLKTFFYP